MCECKGIPLIELLPKSTSQKDKFLCVKGWHLGDVLRWDDGYLKDNSPD